MGNLEFWLPPLGAAFFGAVIGWMVNHVLQRAERVDVKWLASLIGVIGGGAVTSLFEKGSVLFGAYCVGLGIAFFIRVVSLPLSSAINREMEQERQEKEARRQRRNQTVEERYKETERNV